MSFTGAFLSNFSMLFKFDNIVAKINHIYTLILQIFVKGLNYR